MERGYVPASPKVMQGSRLLAPRESQKLSFSAPTKPGVYPFVCTYPGHWRRMYGAMYVVDDLDEYLADPTAYVAKNPLPIADDLLKFTRPRTEWKFDDLSSAVAELKSGRSFGNGKQMFQVAGCISCPRLVELKIRQLASIAAETNHRALNRWNMYQSPSLFRLLLLSRYSGRGWVRVIPPSPGIPGEAG